MMARLAGRLLAVATGVLALIMTNAAAAHAMLDTADDTIAGGRGPFAWIKLTDSNGVQIWVYGLNLDEGGITHPGRLVWSALTQMIWALYQAVVNLALWFLDWAMGLSWLEVIASPLLAIGDALEAVVAQVGAVPVLLTITAIVAVLWMARGRWATGIYEVAISTVIAALATGVLAHPVAMVVGDDGLIADTHRAGLELSLALTDEDADVDTSPADGLRKAQASRLVDVFMVQPTQMVNFGKQLSDKCTKVHAEAVKETAQPGDAPTWAYEDMIRDAVGDCDSAAGQYAEEPGPGMMLAAITFVPAAFVILVLAVLLGGSMIAAGANAVFQAAKLIVHLVTGLLPGGGRGPLLLAIAEAAMSLVIVLGTTIFLGVFLVLVESMFTVGADDGEPPVKTFAIVDVMLVVGVITYWRWRSKLKESAARLAAWMSRRPGASPSRLPDDGRSGLPSKVSSAVRPALRWTAVRRLARPHAGESERDNDQDKQDNDQDKNVKTSGTGAGSNSAIPTAQLGPAAVRAPQQQLPAGTTGPANADPGPAGGDAGPAGGDSAAPQAGPPNAASDGMSRLRRDDTNTGGKLPMGNGPRVTPGSSAGPRPSVGPRRDSLNRRLGHQNTACPQPSSDRHRAGTDSRPADGYVRIARDGQWILVPREQT